MTFYTPMRQTAFVIVLCLLLTISLQMAVCDNDESQSFTTLGTRATEVSGEISSDTTWSGDVTVTDNVDVLEGATLTISPGTKVTFHFVGKPGWDEGYELKVEGTIKAQGTSASKIYFTSDSININPDKVGTWSGVYLDETAGKDCAFEWCNFSYASTELSMYKSNASVRNCEFYNAVSNGIEIMYSDSDVENNVFSFGDDFSPYGISCYYTSKPTIKYNVFYLNSAFGISTLADSAPTISENKFYGGQEGVLVAGDSQPDISRCQFYGQSTASLMLSQESCPTPVSISECLMTGGKMYGVMLAQYSQLKLDTCEASAFGYYGIFVNTASGVGTPSVTNCNLYGNAYAQVYDMTTNEYEIKGCYFGHQAPFTYLKGMVYQGDATSNVIIKDALDTPVDLPTVEQMPVIIILNKVYFMNSTYDVKGKAIDPDKSDIISKVEVSIVKTGYAPETWKTADGKVDWKYTIKPSEFENGQAYDFHVRCQTQDGEVSVSQTFMFSTYYTPGADDDSGSDDDSGQGGIHPIFMPSISNYWTWIEFSAFIITLILGVIGFFTLRSKKRRVKKTMKDIDTLAKAAPTNPQMAETELIRLHKDIKQQYEKGDLEDQHFLILERYLSQALTEVQRLLRGKGLPVTPLTMQLEPAKPDASVPGTTSSTKGLHDAKGTAPPPPPKDR